jgi:GNAT superfamily N-acetyltransferase
MPELSMPQIEVTPFEHENISTAAGLFRRGLQRLRRLTTNLSPVMDDVAALTPRLEGLVSRSSALCAVHEGELAGYFGWIVIDDFRGTGRRAALSLEWMHAIDEGLETPAYNALYRRAASAWQESGVQIHAVSLLAGSPASEKAWFWNGFGLAVVDAVRSNRTIEAPVPDGFTLRQAERSDAATLCELEAEHVQHYAAPPVLMPLRHASNPAEMDGFLSTPGSRIWLAEKDGAAAAYLQFQDISDGAAEVVRCSDNTAITGAYTRPQQRGLGLAPALLDAGLQDAAQRGFKRCSVDFESFNPEASAFWMRYFTPVSFSLIRVPENALLSAQHAVSAQPPNSQAE